jgi:Zn finger protein HypA/HybF involved in hydrogenase expression
MSSWVEAAMGYQKEEFTQTCDCCGAVFRVVVPGQKGHEEPEEYYCPECDKEYKCRASNSPTVSLVSNRTDGLTGPCTK